MNNHILNTKTTLSALLATLTALWGWFGWLVITWALLMLGDWLIGSAAAAKRGEWSSAKLREGAWHKGGQIVIVSVSLVCDWLIGTMLANLPAVELPFTYSVLISALVLVWYILGELGSLVEHAVVLGAPVPSWLSKILAVGTAAIDAAGDKITEGVDDHD